MSDIMNDNELSEIHGKLLSAFMYQAKLANDGTSSRENDVKAALESANLVQNMLRVGKIDKTDHQDIHTKLKSAYTHHINIANDGANTKADDIDAARGANALSKAMLDLNDHAKKRGFVPTIR